MNNFKNVLIGCPRLPSENSEFIQVVLDIGNTQRVDALSTLLVETRAPLLIATTGTQDKCKSPFPFKSLGFHKKPILAVVSTA